jgi:serine/threonine protein kinase
MELCDSNLFTYIAGSYNNTTNPGISSPNIWSITQQMASGIAFLHRKHVFHVHLKSENSITLLRIDDNCSSRPIFG